MATPSGEGHDRRVVDDREVGGGDAKEIANTRSSTMFGITAAQVHLAVNHLPVVGVFLAAATMLVGAVARQPHVRRCGLALAVFAAAAVSPAYFSGDGAEEIVEDRPGVSESTIERHEEAAEQAAVITVLAGIGAAAALVAMWRNKQGIARGLFGMTLAVSLVAAVSMARVAHLGGQIRHDEIRPRIASAATGQHIPEDSDDD
jgi:hypothetical protein